MFDLQALGAQIVKELSSLIDKNVIITDKSGFIIASTDPSRLNNFHEGATLSMRNQKEFHMTKEMCENLKGVRPGIVMPIIVSNTPIGVLGITGKPSEVEKYAKLVRKVAELFITDFISHQEKERGVREVEFFFFDLLMTEGDASVIEERAKMININTAIYQRVVVMQTHQQLEIADVENLLYSQTIHTDLKIIRWGLEKLVLLIPSITKKELVDGLTKLSVKIQKKTKKKLPIGVGNITEFHLLKESFRQAEMAVEVSAKEEKIIFEEDLKLELLYYSIPKEVKQEFMQRTIKPLLREEELLHNLEVWMQKKKSMQEVADTLHIHKNTLTYRLNKIETMLEVDLTSSNDIATLYTALRLYRSK